MNSVYGSSQTVGFDITYLAKVRFILLHVLVFNDNRLHDLLILFIRISSNQVDSICFENAYFFFVFID